MGHAVLHSNDDDDADDSTVQLALELQHACRMGDLEKCKDMIENQGALPWMQDPSNGWSALHCAAGGL
jgi:hypothetical protein